MTTKEKILESALLFFVEQGIDKTSTAQICKAVGISSGGLFVHFKTKQNLVDALYLARKKASLQVFESVIDTGNTVEYNFKNLARRVISYYTEHYTDFLFFRQVQSSPRISQTAQDYYNQELYNMNTLITSWQKSGEVRNFDPPLFFDICWSLISVMVQKMHAQQIEKVDESYIVFLWDCLKA